MKIPTKLFRRTASTVALLWLGLLLTPPVSHAAQSVLPNGDPGITGEGFVTYVGNYGEVFKLRGGWKIDASMQGTTEVINYYPPFRIDLEDSVEPFTPKPSDFAPANFTRLALIQLLVIPRTDAAMKSLDQLKNVKTQALEASGVQFKVIDRPAFASMDERGWPKGTFEILISSPYRLTQLYTVSDSFLCILTSGRDIPPSTIIDRHYRWMRSGLQDWIAPSGNAEPSPAGPPAFQNRWREGKSVRILTKPAVLLAWALMSGLCLMLAGVCKISDRGNRLRRACVLMLVFSNVGAAIGALTGLAMWFFPWPSNHMPFSASVAALFMPFLAARAKQKDSNSARSASMVGITAWTVVCSAGLLFLSIRAGWGPDFSPVIPINSAIAMFFAYAIGAVIFSLTEINYGRLLAALAVILLVSTNAASQVDTVLIKKPLPNTIDVGIEIRARESLSAKLTAKVVHDRAVSKVSATHSIYDYQRVEIKGIWSKADTNDSIPDMFDLQLEPSHIWDHQPDLIHVPGWIHDLEDLRQDANQNITKAALETVAKLSGKDVNEIVAHSWGTEIIYNAIIGGMIKPPKRLIVAGMPDRDIEKWKALSKYTGTEVVIYTNSHDSAAETVRIGGALGEKIEWVRLAEDGRIDELHYRDSEQFERKWAEKCRATDCTIHEPKIEIHPAYKNLDHSRLKYYRQMMKDRVLPGRGNVSDLREAQDNLIEQEADHILESALQKERQLVRTAIEQQKRQLEEQREDIVRNTPLPPLPPPPPQAAPLDVFWQARAMRNLAIKACSGASAVLPSDFDELGIFPSGGPVPGEADFVAGLSGCSQFVLTRMIQANHGTQPLNAGVLSEWVRQSQPPRPVVAPPVYRKNPRIEPKTPNDPCKRAYPGYCNS